MAMEDRSPRDVAAEQLAVVAQCSVVVARGLLEAASDNFDSALTAALDLNEPTVLCIGMVNAQFDSFCESLRHIASLFPASSPKIFRKVIGRRLTQNDAVQYVSETLDVDDAVSLFIQNEVVERGLRDVIGVFGLGDGFIPLCDRVNARLGKPNLFGNSIALTEARRDKYLMQAELQKKGVAFARSVRCASAAEAAAAISSGQVSLPVVVKPTTGAGTEFVTHCATVADVVAAIEHCQGFETTQITKITHFCVQEFLTGNEFVVDVVSYDGVHVVTDVWRSFKGLQRVNSNRVRKYVNQCTEAGQRRPPFDSTTFVYERQEFVASCAPEDDKEAYEVVQYILRCLDALEFRFGSSHSEVMFTADGPRLIEVNPRHQGDVPRSGDLVGYDQLTLTAYLASISGATLTSGAASFWPPAGISELYRLQRPSMTKLVLFFNVLEDGIVCERGKEHIRQLPTFQRFTRCSIDAPAAPGRVHVVEKTHDIFSCPGAILLFGSEENVKRDAAIVRRMENHWLDTHSELMRAVLEWETSVAAATVDLEERKKAAEERGEDPSGVQLNAALLDYGARRTAEVLLATLDPPPLFISNATFGHLRSGGLIQILRSFKA